MEESETRLSEGTSNRNGMSKGIVSSGLVGLTNEKEE